ncbi:MAG: hypothetical protein A2007_05360 [Verrucomicrobia bacterium GWC2_42_7]|nr:MAG: hypothetical protein A2007_05360 [Verrucomicrobia bacterium GWC2_42_7]
MSLKSQDQFDQLSNLLRIKRLEKPSQEFWNRFDEELKQKMFRMAIRKESIFKHAAREIVAFFKNPAISLSTAAVFVLSFSFYSAVFTPLHCVAQDDFASDKIRKILESPSTQKELICQKVGVSTSSDFFLMSGMVLSPSSPTISFQFNTAY